MNETTIIKFNPDVAKLEAMVAVTKELIVTEKDFENTDIMVVVKENRLILKSARVEITKTGKSFRENAIAYQKRVIEEEKKLVAIIEGEEDRLEKIEDNAKDYFLRKERYELLPDRMNRLILISNINEIGMLTEEQVLGMDSINFENVINNLTSASLQIDKNNLDKEKIEADLKIKEQEDRLRKESEESTNKIKEEQDKRESELNQKQIDLENEKAKIEAGEKKKKEDEENKIKEDELLKKRTEYMAYMKEIGWTEETKEQFVRRESETEYLFYKKVGSFKK